MYKCLGLVLASLICYGSAAKILGVFPMASHSHFTLGFALIKELADRGHQVTMVSPFPQKTPIPNYKDISVADIISNIEELKTGLFDMGQLSVLGQIKWVTDMGLFFTEKVLNHKNVQDFLKSNEKFDLVIMEHFVNEAHMVFSHSFKCPLILLAPGPTTFLNNHLFANPSFSSYVPNLLANFGSNMTLYQRLKNTYYDFASELYRELVVLPKHAEILRQAVPSAPPLRDIMYNVSLMLLTSDISVADAVPRVPAIQEIGGHHIKKTKALPADIKQFLDDAKDGVVLFSMGSNIKSADLPAEMKKSLLAAFSKIKQKVLWKFEEDLPDKPSNVKISKWLPQQDILAHPNVKVFITHGGLLSTIEAVHFGVPLIGIPIFWDQELNVQRAANLGYAIKISFKKFNGEAFSNALDEVINNPTYRLKIKNRSKIMHDTILKPLDRAMYWIEYVIRHQGAPHLRSAGLNLHWYQRHLIDIILILTLITVILFIIFYIIIKHLLGIGGMKPKYVTSSKKDK